MDSQQTPFKFSLGDWVRILDSRSTGQVHSRRDGIGLPNHYLVIYQDGHGTPLQAWWQEAQLTASKKPFSHHEALRISREARRKQVEPRDKPQPAPASASTS